MKKNAFTLIELLAVIIILAIIALIAVPIVINIINDTKNSSEEESIKLYEDAVNKMIVKKQMQDPLFNPSKCEIKNDGNLKCIVGINEIDVEVEMKGEKPNKGTVIIAGNKIDLRNVEYNGKKYYQIAKLVNDADNDGKISIGDKYTYKVNDKDTFNFYVLSIEGDKVNLIMDRNICEDGTVDYGHDLNNLYCNYAWNKKEDDNSNGPDISMKVLYNATKDWNNVPDINFKYEDEGHISNSNYGYESIETTETGIKILARSGNEVTNVDNQTPAIIYDDGKLLKARLPKLSEVTSEKTMCQILQSTSSYASCVVWLVVNLKYDDYFFERYCNECSKKYGINKNNGVNSNGYWLLSSALDYDGGYHSSALQSSGCINHNIGHVALNGVRPVITVSKTDLLS